MKILRILLTVISIGVWTLGTMHWRAIAKDTLDDNLEGLTPYLTVVQNQARDCHAYLSKSMHLSIDKKSGQPGISIRPLGEFYKLSMVLSLAPILPKPLQIKFDQLKKDGVLCPPHIYAMHSITLLQKEFGIGAHISHPTRLGDIHDDGILVYAYLNKKGLEVLQQLRSQRGSWSSLISVETSVDMLAQDDLVTASFILSRENILKFLQSRGISAKSRISYPRFQEIVSEISTELTGLAEAGVHLYSEHNIEDLDAGGIRIFTEKIISAYFSERILSTPQKDPQLLLEFKPLRVKDATVAAKLPLKEQRHHTKIRGVMGF